MRLSFWLAYLVIAGSACLFRPGESYPCKSNLDCVMPDTCNRGVCGGVGDSGSNGTTYDASAPADAAAHDAALSDAALSDAALSDAAMSDAALSDAAMSDAAMSDATSEDAGRPDSGAPDAAPTPDANLVDGGADAGPLTRADLGLLALYEFGEGSGTQVRDMSGVAPALDLTIAYAMDGQWNPDGGLRLSGDSVSSENAGKIIDAARDADAFSMEGWFTPDQTVYTGPARVVVIDSANSTSFMLGQGPSVGGSHESEALTMRLRTTEMESTGEPDIATGPGLLPGGLMHVVVTHGNGQVNLWLNGVLLRTAPRGGSLEWWSSDGELRIGNNEFGNRPWFGTFYLLAFYSQSLTGSDVRWLFAGGVHGLSGTSGFLPAPPAVDIGRVTDGLQAYYTFEEGSGAIVYDRAGRDIPLNLLVTPAAGTTWTWEGLSVSGSGVALRSLTAAARPIDEAQATGQFSFEAWFTPADLAYEGPARIAELGNVSADVGLMVGLGEDGTTSRRGALRLRTTAFSYPVEYVTPSDIVQGGERQHMVVTYDRVSTVPRMVVDGIPYEFSSLGTLANWNRQWELVLANTGGAPLIDRLFTGQLHLAAFYSRALSDGEIAQNRAAGLPGRPPGGLVAWFGFDEGAGTATVDRVGGRGGTLVDSPVWVAGRRGGALRFGTQARVELVDQDVFGTLETGTITLWARSNDVKEGVAFAAEEGDSCGFQIAFNRVSASKVWRVWSQDDATAGCVDPQFTSSEATPAGAPDAWHHVAYVVTEVSSQLFLDGVASTSVAAKRFFARTASANTRYVIGNSTVTSRDVFGGDIDEVRIYRRALTVEEVVQDMRVVHQP